jgi:hypothetical protein
MEVYWIGFVLNSLTVLILLRVLLNFKISYSPPLDDIKGLLGPRKCSEQRLAWLQGRRRSYGRWGGAGGGGAARRGLGSGRSKGGQK